MSTVSTHEMMARARTAQHLWAALPVKQRTNALAGLRRSIAKERDTIARTIAKDAGKPEHDALSGDLLFTLEQMLFYERRADRLLKRRRLRRSRVLFRGCSFYEELEPHGVALIFGPSNYPFQLAMVPAITALYASNAVILKVSERTPAVARLVHDLCRASLPENLLQVSNDQPDGASSLIDAGPDLVFFTGSTASGREVATLAAARLIPTVLELGGKDAALVFADCDLVRSVEGVVYGAFANAGQVCVGIKRLYVEDSIYERFLRLMKRRVQELQVGSGMNCDFTPVQNAALRDRMRAQVKDALARGAQLEIGSESCSGPLVLSNVHAQAQLLKEETFGPILCVAPFASEAEAIGLANRTTFALGASVWTNDIERGTRVASALHAGSCAVNDVIRNIANPHASFGGNGASGYGRYHGPQGLLSFSRTKTIMTLRPRRRREIHWFPFTESTCAGLDRLIEMRHRPRGWLHAFRRMITVVAFLSLYAPSSHARAASQGHLRVDVQLPTGHRGRVAWAIFDSPNGFPNDKTKSLLHGFAPVPTANSIEEIDTGPLPSGKYALALYLDENGNGKLDSGLLGIPKEPVGASQNPAPRFGPPRFNDCAFTHGSEDQTIEIRLVHPK